MREGFSSMSNNMSFMDGKISSLDEKIDARFEATFEEFANVHSEIEGWPR
jgi:hypothetical protein